MEKAERQWQREVEEEVERVEKAEQQWEREVEEGIERVEKAEQQWEREVEGEEVEIMEKAEQQWEREVEEGVERVEKAEQQREREVEEGVDRVEKVEQQWEREVEEELETVEVALRGRRHRNRDNSITTTTSTTTVTVTVSNGNTSESEPSNGDRSIIQEQQFQEEELQFSNRTIIDVQKGIEKVDAQQISQKSVYYHQDQGIWKCRHCCWTYQSESPWIDHTQNHISHLHVSMNVKTVNQQGPCFVCETEGAQPIHGSFVTEHTDGFSGTEHRSVQCSATERNPGDDRLDVTVKNLDIQRSLSTVTNRQYVQNLKDNVLSGFSHLPTEKLSEEHNKNYNSFNNNIIEHADINLVKESYQEITELDIESVLEKQNTHDLYCPNCNSCITRRVILRKRKHKIRYSGEDAKRNKLDKVVQSKLDSISSHATNDQGRDAVDIHLDDSTAPAANDSNRDREPEIFRCLSCFSIFIPAGDNFKLFQMFGDKSEKGNTQNWFSSVFSSYKGGMSSEQGSGRRADVEKDNVGTLIPSFNLNTQNGQASSMQEEPSPSQLSGVGGLVNSSTTEPQEGRDDVVPSSEQGPELLGKVRVDVGEKIDDAMKKGTGGAALDHSEGDNIDQLSSLSTSNGMLLNREHDHPTTQLPGGTPVNIGEPAENVTLISQQDGLKLRVPIDVGSLIYEKLKTDQKLNEAIEKKIEVFGESTMDDRSKVFADNHDENDQIVEVELLSGSVIQNESADVKRIDKDDAYHSKLSQHTITGTEVFIHTEEPLKADRDILIPPVQDSLLQERQINVGKDSKDMHAERNADNDTIIVVEGPVEPAASQMAQSIITSAETETMPHTQTQIHVGDQKGIEAREVRGLDIIKSIVYGGLIESITSLGVVSSAAGADASTLNVLALALANLVGGLFLTGHNLWELKYDNSEIASNQATEQVDRYQELLGRRENFFLHATVAVLSFLVFGIVSPVVYGFSFRESDNRDYKLLAVAAASLLCIIILAIGKAYIQRPAKSYIKTVVYYVIIGFMASGVSYVIGKLIKELLEKLGLFQSSSDVAIPLLEKPPMEPAAWRSY